MTNEHNYNYNSLIELIEKLENLEPNVAKMATHNTKCEFKIKKSKYGYWNLKMTLKNERKQKKTIGE